MNSAKIADACRSVVGPERTYASPADCACFSYDAFLESAMPDCVAVPGNASEVAALVAACNDMRVPYVARGAGTGYAGGALAIRGGLVILLTDLLGVEVNSMERWAWVGAGVTTGVLAEAAARAQLRYPPDPSAYAVSTIGGNVATNAGGPHCLGYGVTTSYVLEIEVVGPDAVVRRFGGRSTLAGSLDLRGLLVGAEGTLGIVTGVRVRLIAAPESIRTLFGSFDSPTSAVAALVALFEAGVIPEALDLVCGVITPGDSTPTIDGVTMAFVDVEGFQEDVDARIAAVVETFRCHGGKTETMSRGDLMGRRFDITVSRWRNVVATTSALRYFLFDALTPRSRLSESLMRIAKAAQTHGFHVANTFHAGDGNIHPTPFFDPTSPGVRERLMAFWRDVLADVAELGGVLSGEHGIGIEKLEIMPQFFGDSELALMRSIKGAFDPLDLCNPGKVVPKGSSRQDSRRSLEWLTDARVRPCLVDGYIEAQGECTRDEITAAVAVSPYELAFDPVGWDGDMTLAEAVALGRPGWGERVRSPCRDQFLGGRFSGLGGGPLILGSPFTKDVSAYDLRKLAYGSGSLFGSFERGWLKLTPRPASRFEGVARLEGADGFGIVSRLNGLGLPLRTLALVSDRAGSWYVTCLIEGAATLTARTMAEIDSQSARAGLTFDWLPSSGCIPRMVVGKRYWHWRELADPWDVPNAAGPTRDCVVFLMGCGALAIEREAGSGDTSVLERRLESLTAEMLRAHLGSPSVGGQS